VSVLVGGGASEQGRKEDGRSRAGTDSARVFTIGPIYMDACKINGRARFAGRHDPTARKIRFTWMRVGYVPIIPLDARCHHPVANH
jgi:hypothetical protein